MNKVRRKEISGIIARLEAIKSDIDCVLSDEQDYYDNIPENLQSSERTEQSEEAIEILEEVIENLGEAVENMGDII
jgi:hypothetical protein